MTTASPIPASLATACAAHDRHRLDVLDALLDEAAPSAVRELLGAALDLCATLRTERDELRDKLGAAPKVCAIHSYALEGPCMTCGAPWPGAEKALRQERVEGMEKMRRIARAVGCPNSVEEVVEAVAAIKSDLASERAHLAACRTRIAGLEQAADERSKEVARSASQFDAARGALFDVATVLNVNAVGVTSPDVATRCRAEVARLTARVAELEARPVLDVGRLATALNQCELGPSASDIMRHLGPGPVTLPLPAQDMAERLLRAFIEHHGALLDQKINSKDPSGDVRAEAMSRALASLGAPPASPPAAIEMRLCEASRVVLRPGTLYRFTVDDGCEACRDATATSPPAARPVFAGVSASELDVAYIGGQRECHRRHEGAIKDCCRYAAVAAVLARLEVSLVAPVDPEQIAADITGPIGDRVRTGEWKRIKDAARTTLTAAGIPVTPEVGK